MRTLVAILTIAALGAPALAQRQRAASPQDEGPVLTLRERRVWSLRLDISGVRASNQSSRAQSPLLRSPRRGLSPQRTIDLHFATVAVPVLTRSASHEAFLNLASWDLRFNGQLQTQDRIGNPGGQPDLINLEQTVRITDDSGAWLVPVVRNPERLEFRAQIPVAVHETVYDDARAARIGWPSKWPEAVRPAQEPEPHIPSDDPFVTRLLHEWTDTQTRALPPALLAKHLAKRIVDTVQPNGLGVVYAGRFDADSFFDVSGPCDTTLTGHAINPWTGRIPPFGAGRPNGREAFLAIVGFNVHEASGVIRNNACAVPRIRQPVENGRANPAVIANLYVSLLRAAGIPARVVVGTELSTTELMSVPGAHLPSRTFPDITINGVRISARDTRIRFWTEFYLYDEELGRGEWIPVDLHRQRQESSRAPDIHRPWRYFGNHDELDEIVPFTSVYSAFDTPPVGTIPALWGWITDPLNPGFSLVTTLRIEAVGQARRRNDGLDAPR